MPSEPTEENRYLKLKKEPQALNPNSSIQVNSNSTTRQWGLTEQTGWRQEERGVSRVNIPATSSGLPAEGARRKTGQACSTPQCWEGPPARPYKGGGLKAAEGEPELPEEEGVGGGSGQRGEQTPVTRQEWGRKDEWWRMTCYPSFFCPPPGGPPGDVGGWYHKTRCTHTQFTVRNTWHTHTHRW